jgi:hypothetical protein
MGDIVLAGATSGTTTLTPTAVSGTTTLTLPATTGTVALTAAPTFTGQATIPTINLTGGQITFPATQSASTDANTLDDYEEGTWTPSIGNLSSGSLTYITQAGTYTKIGHLVSVQGWIRINTISSPVSTSLTLNGLPFTSDSNSTRASIAFRSAGLTTVTGIIGLWMNDANTTANLVALNNGGATSLAGSTLANNGEFDFSFSYRASA